MQDTTSTTSWKRFTEKLKGLIIPRKVLHVRDTLPPFIKGTDAPRLVNWEVEGGKSADRAVI